jgi:hypothetical protein
LEHNSQRLEYNETDPVTPATTSEIWKFHAE